jgi:tRNA(Ile)-lysidine synthetase-like protein
MIQTKMNDTGLEAAAASVPAGAWAVGVSGGADSVALLSLLRGRRDLSLEVVHLNHETRGAASDADADFVFRLAGEWGMDSIIGRWSGTEPMLVNPPKNRSARFRAGRIALFQHVVKNDKLRGVVLGHHADDVAETVFQRLLRGAGVMGLAAMRERSTVGELTVLRPLLRVRRETLRRYLADRGQAWREDESNQSDAYQRNRVRRLLSTRPGLTGALLDLADASRDAKDWVRRSAPRGGEQLPVALLPDLPAPLARETARRWLADRGAPPGELTARVLERLIEMSADAASPPRQHFPGGILVRRRAGTLFKG